ncbi:glycosyltransferase family 2 protein [Patescibacteria group bacterium]|nr:glycosyltransferase family 2 protein [Patescibacteria group bacterium]
MSSPSITAIIITKNEELMVANCIETLRWCTEILVVDSDSQDQTAEIAERLGAKVVTTHAQSFADRRNIALEHIKTDWVFYIDADERVTPQLAKEILVQIETTTASALEMHRQNMMYGKFFLNGGWGKEFVQRIFRKQALAGWKGEIHESPIFEGEIVRLHTSLFHLTHRNTIDGLYKTAMWTPLEAKLLFEANTPPVTGWTLLRKTVMEFFRRAILWSGRKDGMEGLIEAGIQAMNRFLVYVQLWELQQQPSLTEKYHTKEMEFMKMWKKTSLSELSPVFKSEDADQETPTPKQEVPEKTEDE